MDRKLADDSECELQKKLQKAGIPVTASNVTLALLYRAGQEALQHAKEAAGQDETAMAKHWRQQALDCFSMIYDLTEDAQIKEETEALTRMDLS